MVKGEGLLVVLFSGSCHPSVICDSPLNLVAVKLVLKVYPRPEDRQRRSYGGREVRWMNMVWCGRVSGLTRSHLFLKNCPDDLVCCLLRNL